MKDPETYLESRGIAVASFPGSKKPRVDRKVRVRLNYEFYYFANDKERSRFAKDPLPTCGLLTDPVSHMRFRPTSSSPRAEHAGIPFYFESPENLKAFAAMPDSFLVPRLRMPPMPAPTTPAK